VKTRAFHLCVLLAAVLATACNLAPKYHVPVAEVPVSFKETNGWKTAQPSDGQIKGNWWEIFNDTQLNQLETQVAISNQNVAAAFESFLAARDVAKEARAAYFPTVTVDPAYTRSRSPKSIIGAAARASSAGPTTASLYQLPAEASWQPDLFGNIRNTVRQSTYAAQVSAAQLENLRLSAQAELASDYFQMRAQDELIQLYETTVKDYQDSVNLTKTLAATGIDSDLDVAQADSLLQTTLAQATALGVLRAQLEHAIAVLIGRPASEFSLKPMPLDARPPQIPVGLPSQLLERRPDIAAAERAVAEANAGIGISRAAFFPTLSLTGTAGFESSAISSLLNASSFYWSIGGNLAETVFDAGKRKAANDQAWANYRSAAATYRETALTAFQQVEDYLAALRILEFEAAQQEVAIKAAQRNYDLALYRYKIGINSYLNVITAQETLLGNRQTAVSIQQQQMTSAVQLIMAIGGGWDASELPSPRQVFQGATAAAK
jgi:NodT family efflux transporter outer membrane factor (OMF) lipoprotein